ncbi:nitric-oxide synthase [Streptoalloteichus tenebrarius]|uniref:Nitric-oxide synthase n=1 Tax=Streptoalloteichus tenebrarius (strain ATCC 17920 / DSM 40477 / JCM 4838 / CBS 697.72 / NBRC 16177 / NCIMB 11028 / NRRL B-12390 / A12253. 1 / ISP 5477) TaxID=1933 RepID=A0ABT1I3H4_STRSD|nr:nitric oxide synthase oxygenase [Streptoalloteichus tenebrarius]MCP2262347.1 nitric-oxide synthase [Streptoalloteichus tenebrarius]BFF02050.1 nitric oxide synthase oxygenase [Streptoalloteichus tenebrarius]
MIALPEARPAPSAPFPDVAVDPAVAEEFLRLFHAEHPETGSLAARLAQVHAEIEATGSYRHTSAELVFGARLALRDVAPCTTRLPWRAIRVRDLRRVRSAAAVADACFEHLRVATLRGRVTPVVTVFAPDAPGRPGPCVWNEQLVRYAGYREPDGHVLGDARYTGFTEAVRGLGWRPPARRGPFDRLPLVVETAEDGPRLFPVPGDVVLEVPLTHPRLGWFAELGLRWPAVPAVSNMSLVVGGVRYPTAPFNAWFVDTEIAVGCLAADDRYGVAHLVAERLGLDRDHERTLWRDQALLEIKRAVLHSFDTAGVTLSDHHTEARRLLAQLRRDRPLRRHPFAPPGGRPAYVLTRDAATRGLRGGPGRFAQPGLPEPSTHGWLIGAVRRHLGA